MSGTTESDGTNTKETQVPVTGSQRITSLDTLRGVAVLGILAMNISAFAMPAAAYFNPTVYGDLTGLNFGVWGLFHIFGDLKFMAVFSMLFGAGIVLMSERCKARDQSPVGLHYRRMLWLIVFGLAHAYLFWYGDILVWYGVCGLLVFLFRNFSPKVLIPLGLLSIALAFAITFAAGLTVDMWPPEGLADVRREMNPPAELIAEEIEIYRGGWIEQMKKRAPKALELQTSAFLFWGAWRVVGLMLLGMGLFKLGVFSAALSKRVYGIFIALAVLVGIPLIIYGAHLNFSTGWKAPDFFFVGLQFNYWASLLVALGWVGVVMLVSKTEKLDALARPFSAVGRMAFSCYILQTVICTTIFYGHGFGLFGSVERTGQALIAVAIWILLLVISPLWLKKFRFGPLEWLWRTLVYMKAQPFVRT